MSLLQQIQDATIATDQPLAAVLRQTMVLAVRLDNQLLRQWTYEELNGYTDEAAPPPYRRPRPVDVLGDFFVYERTRVGRNVYEGRSHRDPAKECPDHARYGWR